MNPNSSTNQDSADRGVTRRSVLRTGTLASLALGTGLAFAPGSAVATNKAELIDAIASESGLSKADTKKALDAFIDTTTKALRKGDRVGLIGFGSFSISKRSARTGRNPQTGKEIRIPAKEVTTFRSAPELAAALDLIPGQGDERRLRAVRRKRARRRRRRDQRPPGRPDGGRERHRRRDDRRGRAGVVIDAEVLARESGLSKADSKKALDAFINATTKALRKGDRVGLIGFGSFSISKRSARTGRNPKTGKEIQIPAKKDVKFKPGAELSEKIT
jgi:nucleoid DNA-binding protein